MIVITALYGLLIGSFLTVVVDRVPRGASVVHPGSACGNCGLRLGVRDLVPVFSWLALRGRCRQCHTSIGIEPLVLELSTAFLFGLTAWEFGFSWWTPAYCVLMAGLVALSWVDLKTQRLPRPITYWTAGLGAPLLCVAALVDGEPERLWMAALGAAIAYAFIGGLYLITRGRGMGFGDVVLAPLLGMYLGFINPGIVPVGLFFGFFIGAVVSVTMMAVGKAGMKTAVPFGPFLALGTVVAVFLGQDYVDLIFTR